VRSWSLRLVHAKSIFIIEMDMCQAKDRVGFVGRTFKVLLE
jgi:hypothetical protein